MCVQSKEEGNSQAESTQQFQTAFTTILHLSIHMALSAKHRTETRGIPFDFLIFKPL